MSGKITQSESDCMEWTIGKYRGLFPLNLDVGLSFANSLKFFQRENKTIEDQLGVR